MGKKLKKAFSDGKSRGLLLAKAALVCRHAVAYNNKSVLLYICVKIKCL